MRDSTSRMVIQKAYINILISFHKFPTLLMVWWFEPVQLGSAWFESLAKPPGSSLGFSLRFGVVWFQVWPKMAKNLTKPNLSNTKRGKCTSLASLVLDLINCSGRLKALQRKQKRPGHLLTHRGCRPWFLSQMWLLRSRKVPREMLKLN